MVIWGDNNYLNNSMCATSHIAFIITTINMRRGDAEMLFEFDEFAVETPRRRRIVECNNDTSSSATARCRSCVAPFNFNATILQQPYGHVRNTLASSIIHELFHHSNVYTS